MVRPCACALPAPGSALATTAAPLRIDRRETSVEGTRAVVSSQQLMGVLRYWEPNVTDNPLQRGIVSNISQGPERIYYRAADFSMGPLPGPAVPGFLCSTFRPAARRCR